MLLNRRQFGRLLGTSAILWPFLGKSRRVYAAKARSIPRFILITSSGTNYADWLPTSASGAPIETGENSCILGLKPVFDKVILVGNLSAPAMEAHGTNQDTTGLGGPNQTSMETYIAQKIAINTPMKTMLLGAHGNSGSRFRYNDQTLPIMNSPLDAYNLAFGKSSGGTAGLYTFPQKSILDINLQQIKSLQSTLGAQEKSKLELHLSNLETLERGLNRAASCKIDAPNLMGVDTQKQENTAQSGALHYRLIPKLLQCGVTNLIGFQWGNTVALTIRLPEDLSNPYKASGKSNGGDEHVEGHSGRFGRNHVSAIEYYLSSQFALLIQELAATPDPLAEGESLLDNTIVYWTRDVGDAGTHSPESIPQVIAGGGRFFKYLNGGHFLNYTENKCSTRRIMLTIMQAMGVDSSDFALKDGKPNTVDFANRKGGNMLNNQVLTEIMK
jgi:hypothetical protein